MGDDGIAYTALGLMVHFLIFVSIAAKKAMFIVFASPFS